MAIHQTVRRLLP